jgi:phosphoribosylformimino-5-aminoimidazole carboxamide ribotide isomerase
MDIIPAVDILNGAVVRLLRGSYDEVTIYDRDPVAVAARFVAEGAPLIHVVDLDAARGRARDLSVLENMARAGIPFQAGGGVRTAADALRTLEAGALRIVVGSVLTSASDESYGIVDVAGATRVVAAIDVRAGRAMGSGWLDGGAPLPDMVARVLAHGIPRALVTGIDRDGTMEGPDIDLLNAVREHGAQLDLIASGGVGTLGDLAVLRSSGVRLEAAIVGKALYESRFTVAGAVEFLSGPR